VAFGSTIQTVMMTKDDIMQLAQGFAALDPIRVLWAMSAKGLPEGLCVSYVPVGANTRIVSWVDYNVSVCVWRESFAEMP
jgi:hypothetical protein